MPKLRTWTVPVKLAHWTPGRGMDNGRVFISYRRGRDSDAAGRLHDRLERIFGRERLFYDIDSIPPGIDSHRYLDQQVAQCTAFLVVIGEGWLEQIDRLRDENDFVRIEVAAALRREHIRVIPVLVQGVAMPKRAILPRPMQPLSRRNAVEIPYAHFAAVVDGRIASAISEAFAGTRSSAGECPRSEEEKLRIHISEPARLPPNVPTDAQLSAQVRASPLTSTKVAPAIREAPTPLGTEIARLEGHGATVTSVAFSPDGTRLATGSWDRTARLWDFATGREIARLEGHGDRVRSVALSPDGTRLATGSRDGTARLWDLAMGREIARLLGHGSWIWSVAFSPDGTQLATGSGDKTARLWDVAIGREVARLERHGDGVRSVAFSRDGARLATASSDRIARLWDLVTGREIARLKGHEGLIRSVVFSPDAMRLVTGSEDRTARIWDVSVAE